MISTFLSFAVFIVWFIVPLTVLAETPASPNCEMAKTEQEKAKNMSILLEHQQKDMQKQVQRLYQNLFICHTADSLSQSQEDVCPRLATEAQKQFQTMIQLITSSHQMTLQLTRLTIQAQKICPFSHSSSNTQISQLGTH